MADIVSQINSLGIDCVEHHLIRSNEHLLLYYHEVVSNCGEGLFLRSPDFVQYCKMKAMEDTEARFVRWTDDSGYVMCDLAGVEFKLQVPRYEWDRIVPGMEITFGHMGIYATGKPREPRFKAVRMDRKCEVVS